MKVLVTGGTGFVGSHLVRALMAAGREVRVLMRRTSPRKALEGLDLEAAYGDLRDAGSLDAALRGCDTIYHAAALMSAWDRDSGLVYETNVGGTRNLLRAALRFDVERVVYTSSVVTLGTGGDGHPAKEETEFRDLGNHYIRSKYMAEVEALKAMRDGLPLVIVNPSAPVGAFDFRPSPIGSLTIGILKGKLPGYFDGVLPLVDVEDLAQGHLLAARKGRIGERYILSTEILSVEQFVRMVAEIGGVASPGLKIPFAVLLAAGFVLEFVADHISGKPPALTRSGLKYLKKASFANSSKAARDLGFTGGSIRSSVEKAVRWFEENGYVRPLPGRGRRVLPK